MRTKKEIRGLIGEGQLAEAVSAAVTYAEAADDVMTLNGLLILQSDVSRQHEIWLTGQLSFEDYSRVQARVTAALLSRVDELPDEPTPKGRQNRVLESRYKWLVFWLLIAAKAAVLLWLFFVWQVQGFQNEEALTAFNAVLPGLMIYGSIMFREMFRGALDADATRKFVPGQFRRLAWVVFILYAGVQMFLVYLKAKGEISFTTMNLAMVGVEAGIGTFLQEVTDGVFKKRT